MTESKLAPHVLMVYSPVVAGVKVYQTPLLALA
jgi:hypothetical protein